MRILYVTTISLTMNTFFQPHIEMLVNEGHEVDIACNFNDLPLIEVYDKLQCKKYQIDFSRSPLSFDNVRAYLQLKKVIKERKYDVVHCHTPNASVITRLACRKLRKNSGLKVFYTAHGFHFYKGAPLLNWVIYYPVEKFCSKYTDKLITINQEDYHLAQEKFFAKEIYYIPGVGIDLSKFENVQVDRQEKRREIGVPEDAFLVLSVGELNENKNHQIVVKALAKIDNNNVHYVIAGEGDKKEYLLKLAKDLGVEERVHLVGYRKDIVELNIASDVFCFPSLREGLGLAALEAMACGLPLITSNIHGINDYSETGMTGYKCSSNDLDEFSKSIENLFFKKELLEKFKIFNKRKVREYELSCVVNQIKKIYL